MKTKRVLRYYCDFCKKSGCSKYHMRKHEKHCTMNPNRECRVCGMLKQTQPDLAALVAILPNPDGFGELNLLHKPLQEAYPRLREAAGECPACIMAAFRQAGIPMDMVMEFSFKKEMQEIWGKINAEAIEEDYRAQAIAIGEDY